nr:restriction endonuclease subunit S [Aminobacter aminovorans]
MKAGWEVRPLRDVADVGAGNPAPQDKKLFEGGRYPFFRTSDVGQIRFGQISASVDLLNDGGVAGLRPVPAGTVLVPKSGASTFLNHRVITGVDGYVSSHLATVTARRRIVEPRFLLYALHRVRAQDILPENSYPSLNLAQVGEIPIPVPPLDEQQRIIAILDEAFEGLDRARANAEANLHSASELFGNYAATVFEGLPPSSETVRVENLTLPEKGAIRTGPFGSQLLHSEFVDDGIAVLGIDNAVSNVFRWGKNRFISPEKYSELRRYTVKPGDVIITIMGTCGRCAVIPDDIPTAINTKHLCCISLDQGRCLPEYLHRYFLFSPKARAYLLAQASGSVMDGLNMGIIKEMPVELPSLATQHDIVESFSAIERATELLDASTKLKIRDIADLRQSLLQKAFAGELTSPKPHPVLLPANDDMPLSAQILALGYSRHQSAQREKTYGHVKAQKLLHLAETVCGYDLGRVPIRDAAGPNDMEHMRRVEDWAKAKQVFEFQRRPLGGYTFVQLEGFSQAIRGLQSEPGNRLSRLVKIIDLLVPMDKEDAEVLATVHAAWSNLIIDGVAITDELIVTAAREDWHPDKMKIARSKFFDAIRKIKSASIEPNGTARYVEAKQARLL